MPVVMDELVLERAPFTLHTAGARTQPAAHPHRRVMPTRLKQSVTLALNLRRRRSRIATHLFSRQVSSLATSSSMPFGGSS
jgi:hypothetical protein